MKEEYDFSKGERGRFYRDGSTINIPVYLDQDVKYFLTDKAKAKGIHLQQLVNDLLRMDMRSLQS